MSGRYQAIATDIGALVELKAVAYGDSVAFVDAVMTLPFPQGIPVERYGDALLLVRVLDKVRRRATGTEGEECAWLDIAGYAIRGVAMDADAKQRRERFDEAVSAHGLPPRDQAQGSDVLQQAVPPVAGSGGAGEPARHGDLRPGRTVQAVPAQKMSAADRQALKKFIDHPAEMVALGLKLMELETLLGTQVWVTGAVGQRAVMSRAVCLNHRYWPTSLEAVNEAIELAKGARPYVYPSL